MTESYSCEPLTEHHRLEDFCCGEPSIDNWCALGGRKAHLGWLCSVWILTLGGGSVDGFFTLSNHTVEGVQLPSKDAGGVLSSPAILIGKLAMRKELRGQGLGSLLIGHALQRSVEAARLSASRLITLDAASPEVQAWYARHKFRSYSDETPLKMYMKMSTAVTFAGQLLPATVENN